MVAAFRASWGFVDDFWPGPVNRPLGRSIRAGARHHAADRRREDDGDQAIALNPGGPMQPRERDLSAARRCHRVVGAVDTQQFAQLRDHLLPFRGAETGVSAQRGVYLGDARLFARRRRGRGWGWSM